MLETNHLKRTAVIHGHDTMTHLERRQYVRRAIGKVGDALWVALNSFLLFDACENEM